MRRKLAAGNWKMNGTGAALAELPALAERPAPRCEVLICPPATLLSRAEAAAAGSAVALGGQDCHAAASGAHTGDISAEMLAEAGAAYVIVGHSERRADHGETEAAMAAGLTAGACLGEDLGQREAGTTIEVITAQLAGSLPDGATGETLVIAYEPVWAIGTGLTPTIDQIAEVHSALRSELTGHLGEATAQTIRLLYGGSVKPSNAVEIFAVADVDGALVGGASLKASDFGGIIDALDAA